jgi:hypothetical protein
MEITSGGRSQSQSPRRMVSGYFPEGVGLRLEYLTTGSSVSRCDLLGHPHAWVHVHTTLRADTKLHCPRCMAAGPSPREPAGLFIDGTHMTIALRENGSPPVPMEYVIASLEEFYNVTFVRKEWHQGTEDGQPNDFHRAISCPEHGHIAPKIRAMKQQSGRSAVGEGRVTMIVEKGVDLVRH